MRKTWLPSLLVLACVFGMAGPSSAQEFALSCVTCGEGDSGMATGDGLGGVGTSDGTSVFRNVSPTFEAIGLERIKDFRFELRIAVPDRSGLANPSDPRFQYDAVTVRQVRFFIASMSSTGTPRDPSLYCTQVPAACLPLGNMDDVAGSPPSQESLNGNRDLPAVIAYTELLNDSIQVDVGESTKLHLTGKQWQSLEAAVNAARAVDPDESQFSFGLFVIAVAVDGNPDDGIAVNLVPSQQILTIQVSAKK